MTNTTCKACEKFSAGHEFCIACECSGGDVAYWRKRAEAAEAYNEVGRWKLEQLSNKQDRELAYRDRAQQSEEEAARLRTILSEIAACCDLCLAKQNRVKEVLG